MMLEELKLIEKCLKGYYPSSDEYYKALFILAREIKIRELDPRKENIDNSGREMNQDG